jgi:hypothetical protein
MPRPLVPVLVLVIVLGLACSSRRVVVPPAVLRNDSPDATAVSLREPLEEVVVPLSPREREPERDADAILRSLHGELLGCYTKRLATHPKAHAHLTLDVLVGEDGRPLRVTTTGGALLGGETLECIEKHVRAVAFEPPRGGGISRVRVPISFHPGEPCEDG